MGEKVKDEPESAIPIIRFCVPTIGTQIVLAKPWTFDVYNEYRNGSLLKIMRDGWTEDDINWRDDVKSMGQCTFPAGTKLKVARIYIRLGLSDFDSLTFTVKECPDGRFKKKGIRFWAKLRDVNKIECFPIGTDPKMVAAFSSFLPDPNQRWLDI
jgi:hypothetical protein